MENIGLQSLRFVYAIVIVEDERLLPPIDDDGVDSFLAYPSEDAAQAALESQTAKWDFEPGDLTVTKIGVCVSSDSFGKDSL